MDARITLEPHGSRGWQEMVALRRRVLRAPLGLRFTEEQLAAEAGQLHLALRVDGVLAGTLLLLPPSGPGGTAKLRQMAVAPERAGQGFGALLMRRAESELRRLEAGDALLAARETAVGFYERFNFVVEGEPFTEVTLPHRWMRRAFPPGT
jgi:predicted GNAT family N-acyltransferase